MKRIQALIISICFILGSMASVYGESTPKPVRLKNQTMPNSTKGVKVRPGPFRVKQVQFTTVAINNQTYLAAGVIFNRDIDAASVQQNVNIRLLMKNENNFWVDASTQNNTVRINPSFITWLSGVPLKAGFYKMHLRGTIKSADGIYLDCNGDGKGEGGNLPAYESQLYKSTIHVIEELELVPEAP